MNISENIIKIICEVHPGDLLFYLIGVGLLGLWLYRTSFGTKALDISRPRRNNMPLFMPIAIIFAVFLFVALANEISLTLCNGLKESYKVFINESVNFTAGLISIGFVLYFVRTYFVRGIKGFGFNINTIPKDLGIAFLYLFAILPVMNFILWITVIISKFVSGPEYTIPTHEQLQTLSANHDMPIRIAIAIGTVFVVPFLEEILFRGLFQTMIRSTLYFHKYSAWIAIFATSFFFAITHANPSHWPVLFILAACMGYSYERSGSLFRPVFIHMLFNASAIISTWMQ